MRCRETELGSPGWRPSCHLPPAAVDEGVAAHTSAGLMLLWGVHSAIRPQGPEVGGHHKEEAGHNHDGGHQPFGQMSTGFRPRAAGFKGEAGGPRAAGFKGE